MQNDTQEINDIVIKHAEDYKVNNPNDTGDKNTNNSGPDLTDTEKAAAEAKVIADKEAADKLAADELEKGKQQPTDTLAELLKELKLDSPEQLKEKLKLLDKKDLSPEEKAKAEEAYEAELQKFAVDNGDMNLNDFHQLKTVKAKADADLVFENYLKEWKDENPDEKEDIEAKAKAEFELEYHLNSENEKTKNRGISKLAKDAKEIRTPLESSYNNVKGKFDTEQELRKEFPNFVKKLETVVKDSVPKTVEWFKDKDGEDEVSVDIELTEEERTEVMTAAAKKLNSTQNYLLHKGGKDTELTEIAKDLIENLVEKNIAARGKKEIADKFKKLGTAKGSNIGAENTFATNQAKLDQEKDKNKGKKTGTEAEQEVLAQFGQK